MPCTGSAQFVALRHRRTTMASSSFRHALPSLVAVHGIVAADDAGDFAARRTRASSAATVRGTPRRWLAGVSRPSMKAVNEYPLDAVLLRHAQTGRRGAPAGNAPRHRSSRPRRCRRRSPVARWPSWPRAARVLGELASLDHHVDPGDVHVHDPARADVQMANFTVAHLPGRQTDVPPAG